jgi:hypothetical protein
MAGLFGVVVFPGAVVFHLATRYGSNRALAHAG